MRGMCLDLVLVRCDDDRVVGYVVWNPSMYKRVTLGIGFDGQISKILLLWRKPPSFKYVGVL